MGELFGLYVARGGWAERWPVGAKYLSMLTVVVPALILQRWWLTVALLLVAAVSMLTSRLGWRALRVPLVLVVFLLVIIGYQAVWGTWLVGLVVAGNLLLALYAARYVVMTSSTTALLDALVAAARPLAWLGLKPERFGLAVGVMVRSIPYVGRTFAVVREAAAARGLDRAVGAQVTTLVVQTVGYAQATADALAARGLDAA